MAYRLDGEVSKPLNMVLTIGKKIVAESVKFNALGSSPTVQEGKVYYDSGMKRLNFYDGINWVKF